MATYLRRFMLIALPVLTAAVLLGYFGWVESAHRASLAEYEAKRKAGWTIIPPPAGDPLGCRSSDIVVDTENRIWVAWECGQGGVSVLSENRWITYWPGNSGLSISKVERLAVAPDGRVWMAGGNTLASFDGRNWRSQPLGDGAYALAVDGQGRIWIGSNRWLGPNGEIEVTASVFEGKSWRTYTPSNSGLVRSGSGTAIVYDVAIDQQDRAWIAVSDGGVSVFDGRSWTTYADENLGLPFVTAIAVDDRGRAWLGTKSGGLVSHDNAGWTVHIPDTSSRGITSGNIVHDIAFDNQGRVWVAKTLELVVLDQGTVKTLTPHTSGLPGLPTALTANRNGRILIVTSRGLALPDPNAIQWTLPPFEDRRSPVLAGVSWFAPIVMMGFWLAVLMNAPRGVGGGIALGLVVLAWMAQPSAAGWGALYGTRGAVIGYLSHCPGVNPGAFATISGMIGGFVGEGLRRRTRVGRFADVMGAVAGVVLGLVFGVVQVEVACFT